MKTNENSRIDMLESHTRGKLGNSV